MDSSISSQNTECSLHFGEISLNSSGSNIKPIPPSPNDQIIKSITKNIEEIILENEKKLYVPKYDIFFLEEIPPISLNDYIKRLVKYSKMNISSLISAIIYIDQYCDQYSYVLSYHNIYRILLVACWLSIKFNEDVFVKTETFAEIAGVSVKDLNNLEYQMFFEMNCKLSIDEGIFKLYIDYFRKN